MGSGVDSELNLMSLRLSRVDGLVHCMGVQGLLCTSLGLVWIQTMGRVWVSMLV